MKITLLNGLLPQFDHGLSKINRVISDTFSELGVSVNEINVPLAQIPVYDGIKSDAAENVVKDIAGSDGIVISLAVTPYSYGGAMQSLFEHFAHDGSGRAFKGKNCMLIILFTESTSAGAMHFYGDAIRFFGGFDRVRILLDETHVASEPVDSIVRETIEKHIEDYYRAVKQNRRFLLPDSVRSGASASTGTPPRAPSKPEKPRMTLPEIYEKLNLNGMNAEQERDVNDIAEYYMGKYGAKNGRINYVFSEELAESGNAPPRVRTCRQMTESLPHYFQPQLAGGLNEIMQLVITGGEEVKGFLSINNKECIYTPGEAQSPDITILSDSSVWINVLKGKITAQKAFMVGQLKVRGNFVLLTKFEQLFNINSFNKST